MKSFCLFGIALVIASSSLSAQTDAGLPRYLTEAELLMLPTYRYPTARSSTSPPEFDNLRNMAEWEEVQALTITWRQYSRILKEIARAAKEETRVIIFCNNASAVENYLMSTQNASQNWPSLPPLNNLDNIDLVEAATNSVWIRDYGANTVYGNRVDTLLLVDWIYNRPRPADDVIPSVLADHMGLELFATTAAPYDLVNTGGNFMSDGQGTGFASKLILSENELGNPYSVTAKTEDDIDGIMAAFQGLSRFIKMEELPFDIISHIDMHMKLLDEETLLVGEYPPGIADGPQINANIDYVLNNFLSHFGEQYNVIRIPMPNSTSGTWPDNNPAAYYRTYTNGVFVNKTFIYPSYREEYDTTAARIYAAALPGYTLLPIDCDNTPEAIIASAGAIHCITHSVGVSDPLLIVHQRLKDTFVTDNPYTVISEIEHRSGIASATLHWRLQGEMDYNAVAMAPAGDVQWSGSIPAQATANTIEYYVEAAAVNGKTQKRPIVAPAGYWSFKVLGEVTGVAQHQALSLSPIYPNPAGYLASVPLYAKVPTQVEVYLTDISGRKLEVLYRGEVYGDQRLSANVAALPAGVYLVVIDSPYGRSSTPLMVSR